MIRLVENGERNSGEFRWFVLTSVCFVKRKIKDLNMEMCRLKSPVTWFTHLSDPRETCVH